MLYNSMTGKWIGKAKTIRYAKELDRIAKQHRGRLTAEFVLEAARNPESPLHDYFLWDQEKAAEKWRRHQAAELITSYRIEFKVTPDTPPVQVTKYVNVVTDRARNLRHHVSVHEVMSDDDFTRQVIERWIETLEGLAGSARYVRILDGVRDELFQLARNLRGNVLKQYDRRLARARVARA